jgi:hypothetical protein
MFSMQRQDDDDAEVADGLARPAEELISVNG